MNADDLVLAIDQGTYSTRAFIFDAQGTTVASSRRKLSLNHLSVTEVEQSAEEILQISALRAGAALDRRQVENALKSRVNQQQAVAELGQLVEAVKAACQ